jgi:hypothetical protein
MAIYGKRRDDLDVRADRERYVAWEMQLVDSNLVQFLT